eukprot:4916348-Pyramimonas_sp.AAC.1
MPPPVGEAMARAPARVDPREDELAHPLRVLLGGLVYLEGVQALGRPLEDLGVVALVSDLLLVELPVLLGGQLVAQPRQN